MITGQSELSFKVDQLAFSKAALAFPIPRDTRYILFWLCSCLEKDHGKYHRVRGAEAVHPQGADDLSSTGLGTPLAI